MSALKGIKDNFCMLKGVQGVVKEITAEDTSGESVVFAVNNPGNSYLYVFKGYSGGAFSSVPETPTADFNFKVTMYRSTGFTGTIGALVRLSSAAQSAEPVWITVKYDNPNFDITDDYTTIHLHFWYDGINYCCHVDGYV